MKTPVDPSTAEVGTGLTPLSADELETITCGFCPRCSYRGFVIGPAAGGIRGTGNFRVEMSVSLNLECGDIECRTRYNVAFYGGEALVGHGIGNGRDGPIWPGEKE